MKDDSPEYVEVDGNCLAYHRRGEGEAVLLVHGITTYSFIWQRVVPLLEDTYQTIAIDLLGCGDSDKPLDVSYSLKSHALRLRELVERLGIDRFHLVGHDLGGGISQILATRPGGGVIDVALLNTVASDFWPVQPISALRVPILRQLVMAALDLGTLRWVVGRALFHRDRLTPELVERFRRPLATSAGRKAFLHFTHCLDSRDLTEIHPALRELDLPVLLLRGERDRYLESAAVRWLQRELPNARLETNATAGHFAQLDEPEWVAGHLRRFFAANSREAS